MGVWPHITINSYFHEGSAPLIFPIPYPSRPPSAIPSPLAVYQRPIRTGCSRRVYHMLVMSMKPGSAQASAAPPRARRTASVLKSWHAAWIMRKTPLFLLVSYCCGSFVDQYTYHMKMFTPRYFPNGWLASRLERDMIVVEYLWVNVA